MSATISGESNFTSGLSTAENTKIPGKSSSSKVYQTDASSEDTDSCLAKITVIVLLILTIVVTIGCFIVFTAIPVSEIGAIGHYGILGLGLLGSVFANIIAGLVGAGNQRLDELMNPLAYK